MIKVKKVCDICNDMECPCVKVSMTRLDEVIESGQRYNVLWMITRERG
jgi:hypothetical protein